MTNSLEMFGQHLIADGYGAPAHLLSDIDLVHRFLDETPDLIGMTKVMPPYAFRYRGKVPEDWGISGFVIIAESHIAIHTFPDRGFLSLDIFSCRGFDAILALAFCRRQFGVFRIDHRIIDRGLEFPRDRGIVTGIITSQRQGIMGGINK